MKYKAILFLLVNVALLWLHYFLFMSDFPMLWFITAISHVIGLIIFPYSKFFKQINNQNENQK